MTILFTLKYHLRCILLVLNKVNIVTAAFVLIGIWSLFHFGTVLIAFIAKLQMHISDHAIVSNLCLFFFGYSGELYCIDNYLR